MVIRKVNRDTFDVFLSGQYWEEHIRVRFGNRGIYRVAGKRVNNKVLQEIASTINGG